MRKVRDRSRYKANSQVNYVYFIQWKNKKGPIKIGIARNVKKRLDSLQTACPYELTVLTTIRCSSRAEAEWLEKGLHKKFEHYWVRGEWFQANIPMRNIRESMIPVFSDEEVNQMALAHEARAMQG